MINIIENQLSLFEPVSLGELADYKLQNRIDTKYVCHINQVPQILKLVSEQFKVQNFDNKKIFGYESLYFDTPGLKSYFDHHQGKRIRYKVRFRKYMESGDVFLEIKKKENYIRTNKKRKEFEFSTALNQNHLDYLSKHFNIPAEGLVPAIWTIFDRITMVGKEYLERVTIDTNIRFKNKERELLVPELVIIEVKSEKGEGSSFFKEVLKSENIKKLGISKYVLGNILLTPGIKYNRFRKKILTINQICYGSKFY